MARKVGKSFSVDDPPDAMDPNLFDVAKFLSAHLENDENLHKFGAQLVSDRKVDVKIILQDTANRLPKKCLALIELWIRSVAGPKWQDLIEAAGESGFGGFATVLTGEFGSRKEPQKESVKPAEIGGTISDLEDIKKKYGDFLPKLLKKLPMKDAIFKGYLVSEGLFGNGDLQGTVDAQPTSAEKATKFLEGAISPEIMVDDVEDLNLAPLYKLLRAMEKYAGVAGTLAKNIKEAIPYSGNY